MDSKVRLLAVRIQSVSVDPGALCASRLLRAFLLCLALGLALVLDLAFVLMVAAVFGLVLALERLTTEPLVASVFGLILALELLTTEPLASLPLALPLPFVLVFASRHLRAFLPSLALGLALVFDSLFALVIALLFGLVVALELLATELLASFPSELFASFAVFAFLAVALELLVLVAAVRFGIFRNDWYMTKIVGHSFITNDSNVFKTLCCKIMDVVFIAVYSKLLGLTLYGILLFFGDGSSLRSVILDFSIAYLIRRGLSDDRKDDV